MHDWNSLQPQERFLYWRDFRQDIDQRKLSQTDIVNEVAIFWASTPIGPRSVDYYTPNTWPTPWEILNYNLFCENSISLMMYYTLELLESFTGQVDLYRVDDITGEYIVPVINNKLILNLEYGKAIPLTEKIRIVEKYNKTNIKNIK
jgi:hypothetical protein